MNHLTGCAAEAVLRWIANVGDSIQRVIEVISDHRIAQAIGHGECSCANSTLCVVVILVSANACGRDLEQPGLVAACHVLIRDAGSSNNRMSGVTEPVSVIRD